MTPVQIVSLALSLLEYGYKAYQYIQGKIAEAEIQLARAKLNQVVLELKMAKTPEAKKNAATDLAHNHDSIINDELRP